jgi:hypothetical protein
MRNCFGQLSGEIRASCKMYHRFTLKCLMEMEMWSRRPRLLFNRTAEGGCATFFILRMVKTARKIFAYASTGRKLRPPGILCLTWKKILGLHLNFARGSYVTEFMNRRTI